MKVFLDTNILIDYLGSRSPFDKAARKIIDLAYKREIEALVSVYCLGTVHYVLSKFSSPKNALEQIVKLRPILGIASSDQEVVDQALNSEFLDFEDALQYFCAANADCEIFISRDTGDFNSKIIPVLEPTEFLNLIENR